MVSIPLVIQEPGPLGDSPPPAQVPLEKSDSFTSVKLKHVPIVNDGDEGDDEEERELVNPEGHYERFDDIDLCEGEGGGSDDGSEGESDLSLVLNELPESERNHIVDVMCRYLHSRAVYVQRASVKTSGHRIFLGP